MGTARRPGMPSDGPPLPDLPPSASPPGRDPSQMTAEQLALIAVALDGFAAQLEARTRAMRAGSPRYHTAHHTMGTLTVTRAQIGRLLAALDAA